VLDLDTSGAVLAAAQEVAALSTQVAALRDAVAVELADAEEAAAARRAEAEEKRLAAEAAALQAALARMSTRIAATDAAPNGEIPVELLCRPRFANVLLRCDAAAALDQLNAAYRAAVGRDLAVSGGYRTYAEQLQVRATKGDLAATPGTSNHGRGLAVDFSDFGALGQFDDADYLWMAENGPRFGWVHPAAMGPGGSGPLEPWHWEFGDL
jgi:LAS superfamily LD-carboxypeptidase LdcB